jgi:hypothetical protein
MSKRKKSEMTIILDRFWRAPKPSSNVCPRLTRITILKEGRGTVIRWLYRHDETAYSIRDHLGADTVIEMGETELSIREFNALMSRLKGDDAFAYTLSELKGESR